MMFQRIRTNWAAVCAAAVILLLSLTGCGGTKDGVTVIAKNQNNPSWTIEDLKFAQEFRGVLENGTLETAPADRGDDYYDVTIKNDLGEWHYKLWIDLEGTSQAAAMDESGKVKLINEYDSDVIRQIFSDAKKQTQ